MAAAAAAAAAAVVVVVVVGERGIGGVKRVLYLGVALPRDTRPWR